jgi:hypothetical protein
MKKPNLSILSTLMAIAPTVLHVREGEGTPPAGTPPVPPAGTPPAGGKTIEQQIQEGVDAAVRGLKAKNDELLGKNKEYQTRLASFGTLDPERAKALMETMDHDEDLKLFSEGKKAVVIEKYTDRMRTSHAAELEAERQQTLAERQRADNYRSAVLDNHIRAVTGDLHKGAVEDALLHARQLFSLDAKGNAVKLDAEGRPELGKDGKTPFSPAEWMEMQRELKPHWFPASTSGSGSAGAQGSGSGAGKTMKRSEFNALTPTQQRSVATSGTRIVD